jgi:hypothetical protein
VRSGYTPDELRGVVEAAGFAVDRVEQWHGPLTHLAYSCACSRFQLCHSS